MIVTLSWKTLLGLLGANISACYGDIDSNDSTILLDINRSHTVTSNCVTVAIYERNSGVASLRHCPSSKERAGRMLQMLFVLQHLRHEHLMQSTP